MRKHLLFALAFLTLAGFALQTASAQAGGPKVVTNRIQFQAKTHRVYKGDFDVWSWTPLGQIQHPGGGYRAARTTTWKSRSPAAPRG